MNDQATQQSPPPTRTHGSPPAGLGLRITIVDGFNRRVRITAHAESVSLDVEQPDGSVLDRPTTVMTIIDAIGELHTLLEGMRQEFPSAFPVTN
jgi:hypothetical protein